MKNETRRPRPGGCTAGARSGSSRAVHRDVALRRPNLLHRHRGRVVPLRALRAIGSSDVGLRSTNGLGVVAVLDIHGTYGHAAYAEASNDAHASGSSYGMPYVWYSSSMLCSELIEPRFRPVRPTASAISCARAPPAVSPPRVEARLSGGPSHLGSTPVVLWPGSLGSDGAPRRWRR